MRPFHGKHTLDNDLTLFTQMPTLPARDGFAIGAQIIKTPTQERYKCKKVKS
jgi:hypothetical protein